MYYSNTLIIVFLKMFIVFSMPKGITFQSNKPTLVIMALTIFPQPHEPQFHLFAPPSIVQMEFLLAQLIFDPLFKFQQA